MINDDKQSKKILQEFHDKKINELKSESEQKEKNLNEQIKLLTKQKAQLEQQLKEVNELCTTKGEQIEKLGKSSVKSVLLTDCLNKVISLEFS